MPEPAVFAVKLTALRDAEALTDALPSPLMLDARAEAIDELVVPEPLPSCAPG